MELKVDTKNYLYIKACNFLSHKELDLLRYDEEPDDRVKEAVILVSSERQKIREEERKERDNKGGSKKSGNKKGVVYKDGQYIGDQKE